MNKKNNNCIIEFDDKRIVYDILSPLILEASAGSGKTTVLVERAIAILIFQILAKKKSPYEAVESIVAITFTKKAASEMKERIRQKVIDCFNKDYLSHFVSNLSIFNRDIKQSEIENYVEILINIKDDIYSALSSARVSTIHSFGLNLIKSNPVESQIGPDISVNDKSGISDLSIVSKDALFTVLQRLIENEDKHFSTLIALLGFDKLKNMLTQLFNEVNKSDIEEFKTSAKNSGYFEYQMEFEDNLDVGFFKKSFYKKIETKLLKLKSLIKEHEIINKKNRINEKKILSIIENINKDNADEIFYSNLSYSYKEIKDETINGIRENISDTLGKLILEMHKALFPLLWKIFADYYQIYKDLKLQKNEITFSDIETILLNSLTDKHDFLKKARSNIRFMLIDEYQDTSDIQKRIFDLIIYDQDGGDQIAPFIVGDPKQSIYGFRSANVDVFIETIDEFKALYGDKSYASLKWNFRSNKKLVDSYNQIFKDIFSGGKKDINYEDQLYVRKTDTTKKEGVYFIRDEGDNVSEIITNSSINAVKIIEDIVKNYGFKPKDIMILIRQKTNIKILNEIFSEYLPKSIPFVNVNKDNIFQSEEIENILIYLRALDNPHSDFTFLPILKSPFFRMMDIDILSMIRHSDKKTGRLYNMALENNSEEIRIFKKLHEKKSRLNVSDLVEEIVAKTGYFAYVNSLRNKKEAATNIIVFQDKLREIQSTEMFNLTRFLYYLTVNEIQMSKPKTIGEKSNVIKVMTIHSAKGLEAKAVIYITTSKGNISQNFMMEKENGLKKLGLNFFKKDYNYTRLEKINNILEIEEERRLAYVAFTRARDCFFYIGAASIEAKNTNRRDGFLEFIHTDKAFVTPILSMDEMPLNTVNKDSTVTERNEARRDPNKRAIELEKYWGKDKGSAFPEIVTITQILDMEFESAGFRNKYIVKSFPFNEALNEIASRDEYDWGLSDGIIEQKKQKRQNENSKNNENNDRNLRIEKGVFLHKIFQFAKPSNYLEFIERKIVDENEAVIKLKDSIIKQTRDFFEGEFYKEKLSGLEWERCEWEVNYPFRISNCDFLIKGGVDKFVRLNSGKTVLIDYKLKISDRSAERYSRQINYYAYILETLGYAVDEMYLYDIEANKPVLAIKITRSSELKLKEYIEKIVMEFSEVYT